MNPTAKTFPAPADTVAPGKPVFPTAEHAAAVEQERSNRDFAFLGITHDLCGIPVRDITLRQLLVRLNIGCPIMHGKVAGPEDIASFLWYLSASFVRPESPSFELARKQFTYRVAQVPYDQVTAAIKAYLDYTFLDAPGSSTANKVPRTSIAATIIDMLGEAYGWTDEKSLDTAMVRIYQLLREIQQRKNPKAILGNRKSDRVTRYFMLALKAWRDEERKAAADAAAAFNPEPTGADSSRRESAENSQAERL